MVTHTIASMKQLLFLAFATLVAAEEPLLLPQMPLHDPFIVAHGPSRTYYLYTSNLPRMSGAEGRGTMVYKSKDLKHWEKPKQVFAVPPAAFAQEGAWAPEVHEYKGRGIFSPRCTTPAKPSPNHPPPCSAPTSAARSRRFPTHRTGHSGCSTNPPP